MFAPVKTYKVLNLLGILGIFVSFVLTVTFNALAGSGSSKLILFFSKLFLAFINDLAD